MFNNVSFAIPQRGFTLIELLVVMAIIGILAGIILASLGSVRSGATDAKVKGQVSQMRSQAELYSGTGSAFPLAACPNPGAAPNTLFDTSSGGLGNLLGGLTLANTRCASAAGQPRSGAAWAVSASLNTAGQFWCADSTGASKQTAAHISTTVCP